jgi:hypothetical protein
MALLLLYSLRKRSGRLSNAGKLRHWFAVHMMLGLFGPVAILFHANFELGSTNSTVALISVLTVSSSGIIGRFVYPKLHRGLYGRRVAFAELVARAERERESTSGLGSVPGLAAELEQLQALIAPAGSTWNSIRRASTLGFRLRAASRRLRVAVGQAQDAGGISGSAIAAAERQIEAHIRAVRRASEFSAYERIFSVWHAAHLPLCVMLFGAAGVHVLAVHMY